MICLTYYTFYNLRNNLEVRKEKRLDKDVTKTRTGYRTVLYNKHTVLEMDNNKRIRLQAEKKIYIRFLNSPRPIKYSFMTS